MQELFRFFKKYPILSRVTFFGTIVALDLFAIPSQWSEAYLRLTTAVLMGESLAHALARKHIK